MPPRLAPAARRAAAALALPALLAAAPRAAHAQPACAPTTLEALVGSAPGCRLGDVQFSSFTGQRVEHRERDFGAGVETSNTPLGIAGIGVTPLAPLSLPGGLQAVGLRYSVGLAVEANLLDFPNAGLLSAFVLYQRFTGGVQVDRLGPGAIFGTFVGFPAGEPSGWDNTLGDTYFYAQVQASGGAFASEARTFEGTIAPFCFGSCVPDEIAPLWVGAASGDAMQLDALARIDGVQGGSFPLCLPTSPSPFCPTPGLTPPTARVAVGAFDLWVVTSPQAIPTPPAVAPEPATVALLGGGLTLLGLGAHRGRRRARG